MKSFSNDIVTPQTTEEIKKLEEEIITKVETTIKLVITAIALISITMIAVVVLVVKPLL